MVRPSVKLHELFGPLYRAEFPQRLAPAYTVGLVITVYNRPGYLKRTLQSLCNSDFPDTVIMLIDDLSDDQATLDLVEHCSHPQAPISKSSGWDLMKSIHVLPRSIRICSLGGRIWPATFRLPT